MKNIKEFIQLNKGHFRIFDGANELVRHWSINPIVWSWGAHAWKLFEHKILRFTVNGHHHKGHVYIVVNHNDLFDVYLTSSMGNIKSVFNDVYIEDLTGLIDEKIEKISTYKF